MATAETATLAKYLNADLERITSSANDELKIIRRSGMADSARQVEEARVINEARARAVRRVESTVRQLRTAAAGGRVRSPRHADDDLAGADIDETQVIPVIAMVEPAFDAPEMTENRHHEALVVDYDDEPEAAVAEDRDPAVGATVTAPQTEATRAPEVPETTAAEAESDAARLRRLVAFVARQEPRLNWAVGDHEDGTTVLVTDLAHGWIPPGIKLPAGVRLLEPGRRIGKVSALIGDSARAATYTPGDPLGWSIDFAATQFSVQPRELPAVQDLGWQLSHATHWRDGMPRIVHTLAKAAAAGTGVVEDEADLLRVHLDTARYQVLDQYPDVDLTLLLNCVLVAATERIVSGDSISANYHFTWFQKLETPPGSGWAANP
jgi:Family of unknown function (DUF5631)/Family of unknown function (DUF5632)